MTKIFKRMMGAFLALSMMCSGAVYAETASPSVVEREDGFVECMDANGQPVTSDYVQTGDGKLYFFNAKGIGVEIEYVQLADHMIQIFDNTADSCFIVMGEEKAAVIDGMNGTIDLAVVAKYFTDKPLIALATHGHGDHIGGLNGFAEVYIGEADMDMWRSSSGKDRFRMLGYDNYLFESGKTLDYSIVYLPEDMMETNPDICLLPLNDGDVFDLGGVSVEALSLVGHTPGSCAFLIREDRVLITGDAANMYTQVAGYPVAAYCENLKAVKAREAEYDEIYSSHGALRADGSNSSHMAPTLIDELIEGCESILSGENEGVEPGPGTPTRWCYAMGPGGRLDGKCGNFMFNPKLIN